MTATLPTTEAPPPALNGRLPISLPTNRWSRLAVLGALTIALFSAVRIIADVPGLTAGSTFIAAVAAMAPILFAGLGGLYSERSGIVNIGLDGMMVMGTWFAGWAGWQYGPWAALLFGAIGGMLGGLVLGIATVTFGVDQIVAGIAINLIAPGVTRFLSSEIFVGQADGSVTNSPTMASTIGHFSVPFLAGGTLFGWKTPTSSAGSTTRAGSGSPTSPASSRASPRTCRTTR